MIAPGMGVVFMTVPDMNYTHVDLAQRMDAFGRNVKPHICQLAALESMRKPAPYVTSAGETIPGYGPLSKRAERAIATLHFQIESSRRWFFPPA